MIIEVRVYLQVHMTLCNCERMVGRSFVFFDQLTTHINNKLLDIICIVVKTLTIVSYYGDRLV